MKISFGMLVFNGDYVLQENLETIYPYAHEIVISEGPVSHYQKLGFKTSTDDTVSIIKNFPDPQGKIKLIQSSSWANKDAMCHAFLAPMTGDYVWHIDSDEIYLPESIEKVIDYLDKNKDTCYSMAFKLNSFYGGLDYKITGFEETFEVHRVKKIIPGKSRWLKHRPPTMIWPPTGKTCKEMGHIGHNITDSWGIRIFHYSYVFPTQVKSKSNYYHQRNPSGIVSNYWDSLFVPWMRAKTPQEKHIVEIPTQGVHVWLPKMRGQAYTEKFTGQHPKIIENSRAKIESRILNEMKIFGI